MPNFTRRAIQETFLSLLDERPLSSITVKDIVEACGINRNSFYYHYRDLPDLVEEILREEAERIIGRGGAVTSVTECYDAVIDFASHRRRAIMHIYRSVSRDVFERYLMDVSEFFIRQYLSSLPDEVEIPAESCELLTNYYSCLCFGLVLRWLSDGMPEDKAASIRRIFELEEKNAAELARLIGAALPQDRQIAPDV